MSYCVNCGVELDPSAKTCPLCGTPAWHPELDAPPYFPANSAAVQPASRREAAITHDIACPLCREKYGNTNGKRQEEEGGPLVRSFLADAGLSAEQVDRVAYLVSHHHTYTGIDGIDYQILIEADYIVNASESGYSPENRKNFLEEHMKTESGKRLLRSTFCMEA